MADNDVDEILQKFFVTIAEKDEDAFKLYEDNKRMRDLVEQTLHAREELESRHRSTVTLVHSLQTALQEKERLIAAQDREAATSREHIAELRTLLHRPSELDHGLDDVVADVRDMSAELRSLRHAFQYAQWCCDGWEEYAATAVVQAETRERVVLEEAEAVVFSALCTCAGERQRLLQRSTAQTTASVATIKEWEAWYARAEHERAELVERHESALQSSAQETQQERTRVADLQRELDAVKTDASKQTHLHQQQFQLQCVEQEHVTRLVKLVEDRCQAAETAWASSVDEVRRVVHLLSSAQKERDELAAKYEFGLITQEHNRQRLLKLSKQVDQLKRQQSDFEELQLRCNEKQEELRVLREKYAAVMDRERNLRQQMHAAADAAAAKLQVAEDAASTHRRHRFSLEQRLRTTQVEVKTLQKESGSLRQQCDELRATQAVLQATQAQLRETEKHSFNFQAALDRLREEQQAELRAVEARHEAERAELTHVHEAERAHDAQEAQAKLHELEATLQQTQEAHSQEKAQLQRELQEWIHEVETHKKEKAAQQDQLEAERKARRLLEQQYRQETSIVRSMMTEQSREEAQRGPQLAELESQMVTLIQRNNLLEEACRRSASAIAQLREALHHEQTTSRRLRQRDASLSL
jgi:chromosome segregation ATPase